MMDWTDSVDWTTKADVAPGSLGVPMISILPIGPLGGLERKWATNTHYSHLVAHDIMIWYHAHRI